MSSNRIGHKLLISCFIVLVVAVIAIGCSGADSGVIPAATSTGSTATIVPDPVETNSGLISADEVATEEPAIDDGSFKPGVEPSSIGPENGHLQVRLQGAEQGRVPLNNGGVIRLEEDLTAEILINPYPTDTLTTWVDLYLHDGNDQPVTGSKVVIDYDMYSMAHGPFFSLAEKSDTGHYIFRLDFLMFGPWGQLLQVKPPNSEKEHNIELVIVAVP